MGHIDAGMSWCWCFAYNHFAKVSRSSRIPWQCSLAGVVLPLCAQAVELGWLPRVWDSEEIKHAIATGCDAFLPQNETTTDAIIREDGSNSTAGVWAAATAEAQQGSTSLFTLPALLLLVGAVVAMVYYVEGAGWVDHGFVWDRRRQQYTPLEDRDTAITSV